MKLLRYGPDGKEKPRILDTEGALRDLSSVVADIDAEALSPAGIARLSAVDPKTLPLVSGKPRLGVPVSGVSKLVAIGLNYSNHAKGANMAIPSEPVVFMKAPSSLCGPDDDVVTPKPSWTGKWRSAS